jgi:hypothetical protein
MVFLSVSRVQGVSASANSRMTCATGFTASMPATLRPACQKSCVDLGSSDALRSCIAERTA